MANETIDPAIVQLEAEIHQSRVSRWEVETFLADRHRAKIEALSDITKKPVWPVFVELANLVFALIGQVAVAALLGLWLIFGLS